MVEKKKRVDPTLLEELKPSLKYYNHLKKLHEAYEARRVAKSIRDKVRKEQDRINRQNEYERLLGELTKSSLPFVNRTTLENRTKELEKLGVKSVGK
jgi:hypothetical protein